jgi:hypothetical protein
VGDAIEIQNGASASLLETDGSVKTDEKWLTSRVTRLAEFSPNGRLFTLSSFLQVAEAALIFGRLFPTVKVMH